jgi:hypothetical protein
MTGPRLTDARHLALRVAAYADRTGREVRVSNRTTSPDDPRPAVYWQTARWLVDEGLAVDGLGDDRDGLRLTPAGRDLAAKLTARSRR